MLQREIVQGVRYLAKVNGNLVAVRVDDIRTNWQGRHYYNVTNTVTGRRTTFRSAAKFRRAA